MIPVTITHPAPGCKGELVVGHSIFLVAGDRSQPQSNLACYRSDDKGSTWTKLGTVVIDPVSDADLGDGNLVRLPNGHLLVVYRRNHMRGEFRTSPEYGVHVSESADGGKSWKLHSMVAQHRIDRVDGSRGYWAPFLFLTHSGKLQCYYDDEYTPYEQGFKGHQWVEMKTYDPATQKWAQEVTVSRAPNPLELSRDGMATVVETEPNRLICVLESVSTTRPVVGDVREVTSDDGGKTWSWKYGRRPVVYQAKGPYHSFSPWIALAPDQTIYCLFATDEDNGSPQPAGTPANRVRLDIKLLSSHDGGSTWDQPQLLYAGTHHNYLPSAALWNHKELLLSWLDFDKGPLFGSLPLPIAK